MKSIEPIAPVHELLRSAVQQAPSPTVAPELAQKFEALMARSDAAGVPPAAAGPNVVTDVMVRQEGMLNNVQDEVYGLMQAAPHMTATELGAASMIVSRDIATSNFKLQAASSITSGSNKSLQTLLKNQ